MQRSPVEARAAEVPCSLRVSVQAPKASGLAQVTAEVRGVLNDAPWRQKRGGQGQTEISYVIKASKNQTVTEADTVCTSALQLNATSPMSGELSLCLPLPLSPAVIDEENITKNIT